MSHRLLNVEQFAERIGRSPAQARWMIHTGNCPASAKIAGRRMFREVDVEAWIDSHFEAAAKESA